MQVSFHNVIAANCEKLEAGNCLLDMNLTPDGNWWKGMLLLVLRDAMEGDLQIGWGKAKGYGTVVFEIEYDGYLYKDWVSILAGITTAKAEQWVKELHEKINLTVQSRGGER